MRFCSRRICTHIVWTNWIFFEAISLASWFSLILSCRVKRFFNRILKWCWVQSVISTKNIHSKKIASMEMRLCVRVIYCDTTNEAKNIQWLEWEFLFSNKCAIHQTKYSFHIPAIVLLVIWFNWMALKIKSRKKVTKVQDLSILSTHKIASIQTRSIRQPSDSKIWLNVRWPVGWSVFNGIFGFVWCWINIVWWIFLFVVSLPLSSCHSHFCAQLNYEQWHWHWHRI